MTLSYSSRRSEVMLWYLRTYWKSPRIMRWRLINVAIVMIAVLASRCEDAAINGREVGAGDFAFAGLFGLLVLVVLALYPLLMFKSQKRILTTSSDGIETTIGRQS